MKKIGIVSCDKWKNKIQEDLLLQREFMKKGRHSEIISWQDKTIDYNEYECLILRSVWGYQDYYNEFKNWLLFIKANNITLFNDADIILNNIRKDKQFEILNNHSIPYIQTTIIKNYIDWNNLKSYGDMIVIKPIISGSGNNTYKFKLSPESGQVQIDDSIIQKYERLLKEPDNGLIIQPFIPSIKNGEYACVFIDGINTHNMLRFPGVFSEKKHPYYLTKVPKNVLDLAKSVSILSEFDGYLFMRVDIVVYNDRPYIMEVELAEPDLLVKYIDDKAIQQKVLNIWAKKIEGRI